MITGLFIGLKSKHSTEPLHRSAILRCILFSPKKRNPQQSLQDAEGDIIQIDV